MSAAPFGSGRVLVAKVCGLTRPEDVDAARDAGADLVGFVSHGPSPRHLQDVQIVALAAALEGSASRGVLVTVDRARAEVERVLAAARLGFVQLCGGEVAADWRDAPFGVLRRVAAGAGAAAEIERWREVAAAFVVDHPASPGGSGQRVPVAGVLGAVAAAPCLLAGGLGPEVLEAGLDPRLREAGLAGVDASSGLEHGPGRKDHELLRRFVRAAHRTPAAVRAR